MGNQTTPTDRWARLRAQLTFDEGSRLRVYRCTAGHLTVGKGHNLDAKPIPGLQLKERDTITRDQEERLFALDLADAVADVLRVIPFSAELAPARFDALANMAFNMGIGRLLKFKKLLADMARGDWEGSVHELDDSIWSHQVDDGIGGRIGRADRIAALIKSGEYTA